MTGQVTKIVPLFKLFSESDDLDRRILYTQVWIALRKGTSHRRCLPEELVSIIVRLADFREHDQSRTISCDEPISLVCWNGEFTAKEWFQSPPLTEADISHLAAMQLITLSADQGWAAPDQSSWSWFDIGALPVGYDEYNDDSSNSATIWKRSHHNRLAFGKIAFVEGPLMRFNDGDALMVHPGDRIVVRACARCSWWVKWGHRGELRFWRWFEPIQDVVQKRLDAVEL